MNHYLAKSNPEETIQEHTDNLIKNYNFIKSIYPNLQVNWDILYLACLYHDLGKMNQKFQHKIETGKILENEIPHGILSLHFIDVKDLKNRGFDKEDIKILAHSIAYHHERDLSYDNETLDKEIELLKPEIENFKYEKLQNIKVKKLGAKYFSKNRIYEKDGEELFFHYILIKGLLNRIDYAASGYIDVEIKNDFLEQSLENLMKDWQEKNSFAHWNALQEYMISNREKNVIAIAETGMGKTEAGLLWIGNHKGFFTLPLKTAINAMYDRISNNIVKEDFSNKVGLLHSDTYSEYLNKESEEEDLEIDEYYNKTRQLSLPLTICTLDQIFDFVYRYRGFESKLATLAYSKVVIDEVQMYSSDLLAYLVIGLSYITKIGGKFAILTATLPSLVEDLLREEGIDFVPARTFTTDRIRHSIKVVHKEIDINDIVSLYDKNKVLVICNTVKEAQRIYKELDDLGIENLNLLHSNFIKKHRKKKEDKILKMGHKDSKEYGIWVTTQIVEASLDIDFDLLITELSDLNGLFQRMGRCYRNRSCSQEGYNCYVYDGGDKQCSGIRYVIDKDIFKFSKEALKDIDGLLKEEEKMNMVKSLYTTENLKNTKYYEKIKVNIQYVKSIEDHEKSKSEIKRIFRNIHTKTVIPIQIYNQYRKEIENNIEILATGYSKSLNAEERKELKREKVLARNDLMQYTLSVPYFRVQGNILEDLIISKYESIPVLNCEYSEEIGIQYPKKKEKEELDEKQQMDHFI